MKRGQILVPAVDTKGKHGQCDILDLDESSFRMFIMTIFMRAGWVNFIEGNSPKLRNVPTVPLMAKDGVSFALDKEKKPAPHAEEAT